MQQLIELSCIGEISPGIFSVGSRGRDIRRAAREGGHPPKVVGSGKGERASRVGEDKGTSHSHGRIPIAVLGSNQCQDHGRSFAVIGRATISIASLRSLIDCCIFRFISSKNYRKIERFTHSISRDERKEQLWYRNDCTDLFFGIYCRTKRSILANNVISNEARVFETMLNRGEIAWDVSKFAYA